MSPGLPGTGIGGLFYLISAILMPIREIWQALILRDKCRTRLVIFQFVLAAGISVGLWLTGWLLAVLLVTPELGTGAGESSETANFIHAVTIVATLGLLGMVLISVHVLRYALRLRKLPSCLTVTVTRLLPSLRRLMTLFFIGVVFASPPMLLGLDVDAQMASLMRRADSAFDAGDFEQARQMYGAVLDADPSSSRAVFQVARLMPTGSNEQICLFRRYVELEPSDPWGYMALGDALAEEGKVKEALLQYDRALEIAPSERDARIGVGRILMEADRIDAAIKVYEMWAAERPEDALAWRELGRAQQRAGRFPPAAKALKRSLALQEDTETLRLLQGVLSESSPSLTPFVGRSSDSDGNIVERMGLTGDRHISRRVRFGFTASRIDVEDDFSSGVSQEFGVTVDWRPDRVFLLHSMAGMARTYGRAPGQEFRTTPVFDFRARWNPSGGEPSGELRATRSPIAATPRLIAQPVVLEELRGKVESPLHGPVRIRFLGRLGSLDSRTERNRRIGYGGGIAVRVKPVFEVSTIYHELSYARASAAGYFAPRLVKTVEAGIYFEREISGAFPLSIALDAGAGAQRLSKFGGERGRWGPALRLWGLAGWNFRRNLLIGLEVEASQSHVPVDAFAPTSQWRYTAAMLSLRWAVGAR